MLVCLYHLGQPALLDHHFQLAQQHLLLPLEFDYHHLHQFTLDLLLHLVPDFTLVTHSRLMSSRLRFVQLLGYSAPASYYHLLLVFKYYFNQVLRLTYYHHMFH